MKSRWLTKVLYLAAIALAPAYPPDVLYAQADINGPQFERDAALTHPFWAPGIVTRETLQFIQEDSAPTAEASLTYPATRILSVRSADVMLAEPPLYTVSVDYEHTPGERVLTLTPASSIPFIERVDLYPLFGGKKYRMNPADPLDAVTGLDPEQVYVNPNDAMQRGQVEVTYLHESAWGGYVPPFEDVELAETIRRLRDRDTLNVLVRGDSISKGLGASRWIPAGSASTTYLQEGYAELLAEMLASIYDHSAIQLINSAVPGARSDDHVALIEDDVRTNNVDLLVLAYGMNDSGHGLGSGSSRVLAYSANVDAMIQAARLGNPDVEIILVSPMPANPEWTLGLYPFFTSVPQHPGYTSVQTELRGLAATYAGVAMADVTAVWNQVLEMKGWTYQDLLDGEPLKGLHDLSGNGINHPNDFGHRLYAQTLLGMLVSTIAANDVYTVPENGVLKASAPGVLANDSTGSGGAIEASLVEAPTYGTVVLAADGSFTYTPLSGYRGVDSFAYRVAVGGDRSNVAMAFLLVGEERDTDPVAYWPFDSGAGDVALDFSGNRHNGARQSADWAAGAQGSALCFDGVADHVRVEDHAQLDFASALTVAAWINVNALENEPFNRAMIVGKAGAFQFGVGGDGSVNDELVFDLIGVSGSRSTGANVQTGVWMHVAVTYDSTHARFYVDGAEVGASPLSGAIIMSGEPLLIGDSTQWPDHQFDGCIDQLRLYGRALSPAELAVLGTTPRNDPPQAEDDHAATARNTPVAIDVLDNDSDPDGNLDRGSLRITRAPAHGSLAVDAVSGVVTYTPQTGFSGSDSFDYEVCDLLSACDSATVMVGVDADLALGLVAHWAFEEGTGLTTHDSTVNGNDGTVNGSQWVAGARGRGLHFDGDDDHVAVPNDSSLNLSSDITVAAWINVAALQMQTYNRMMILGKPGAYQFGVGGNDPVNDELVFTLPGVWDAYSLSADIAPGLWTHVAVTYNGVEARFFVNGLDVGVVPRRGRITSSAEPVRIGDMVEWEDHQFSGALDDVRLYDRALSPGELFLLVHNVGNTPPVARDDAVSTPVNSSLAIDVLRNDDDPDGNLDAGSVRIVDFPDHGTFDINPVTGVVTYHPEANYIGPDSFVYEVCDTLAACDAATVTIAVLSDTASGLLGNWTFEAVWGTTTYDVSGRENHGRIWNARRVGTPRGAGLLFDGQDDVVMVPHRDELNCPNGLTAAAWIKVSELQMRTYNRLIILGKMSTYQFGIGGNSPARDELVFTLPQRWDAFSTGAHIRPGVWYHVAVTYDGAMVRFYVNGRNVGSVARTGRPRRSQAYLRIGDMVQWPGHEFNGCMDEVRLYGHALTGSEIVGLAGNVLNQPPHAGNDFATAAAGDPVTVEILDNDSDPEGALAPGSVVIDTPPAHGSASVDPVSGAVTYTADAGFEGIDALVYSVCDELGQCDSAVLSLAVFPGLSAGLAGHWRLDEGSGATVADASGQGNDGDLAGADWDAGYTGSGLQFDGGSGHVSVADSPALDIDREITMAAWINVASFRTNLYNRTIVLGKAGAYQFGVGGNSPTNSALVFTLPNAWDAFSEGVAVPQAQWVHVAVTYDGGLVSFYVDGALVSTTAGVGNVPVTDSSLRLGDMAQWPEHTFDGNLDEIRLYNRALHSIEIEWLFSGMTP